jgi:hypothetical protein
MEVISQLTCQVRSSSIVVVRLRLRVAPWYISLRPPATGHNGRTHHFEPHLHNLQVLNGFYFYSIIMFVLQTTTAILIAFLAVIAYNEVRNRLARGRSRRKDLESPGSPPTRIVADNGKPIADDGLGDILDGREKFDLAVDEEMETHKQLYFKLHNVEHHPDILPECHQLLLSLLSSTLTDALKQPSSGILSVQNFSRDSLNDFLKAKDTDVTDRWEQYLARRKTGGPREMFQDVSEAKWWLKQAAPVKYVDGAWLGHINKISTQFKYRHITKNAWQVMSEELGDGDLAKNHVEVYRNLMNEIGAGLPAADSEDFIHPRHELNEARCWKAAIAQLTVSLFPHDFLPEALGFNMAYESLPLHLLKTVKELRELRLNPYYFELHISIDNADSGHAAMAMATVVNYINLVRKEEGEEAAHNAWRRVQTGYILAEGLPTTPESPSQKTNPEEPFPRSDTEASVLSIFAAKSFVAHKIHCNSRLKIGRRSLVDWLEPNAFTDKQWQKEFLHDLSNCKPWVVKGSDRNSRLVKELSWEGKMFGSFTEKEVEVVKSWINELGSSPQSLRPDPNVYYDFTRRKPISKFQTAQQELDILIDYPVLSSYGPESKLAHSISTPIKRGDKPHPLVHIDFSHLNLTNLLPLWFASCTLLEALPSVPVRASTTFGSAIVRILRAQTGFDSEGLGVAGMDEVRRTDDGQAVGLVELGLDMCRRADLNEPKDLREVVAMGNGELVAFSEWMVWMSVRWLTHQDVLVGMAWAFMEMHEAVAGMAIGDSFLDLESVSILRKIAERERMGLEVCRKEIHELESRKWDFERGTAIGRETISLSFK